MDTCQICTEKFNKSSRKQIECLFCNKICCKDCVLGNIKSNWESNPEHCLFCKESWDLSFWFENFVKKEIDTYFKGLMFKKAIDTEQSKLHEYQEMSKMYKLMDTNNLKIISNTEIINKLKVQIFELQQDNKLLSIQYQNASEIVKNGMCNVDSRDYSVVCPSENCKFMLNRDYHCENCKINYCKECFEPVENADSHVCDKETIETIKLIKKNSKPCPGCGTSISKIDGCDQMWCIICKKGFSWKTGKLETGRIHNPEYFRWIQEHGEVEEDVNQIPVRHNNCVLPDNQYFYRILREWLEKNSFLFAPFEQQAFLTFFINVIRFGGHVEYKIESNERKIEIRNNVNTEKSAKYLSNLITKEDWESNIKYTASLTMNVRDYTNIYQLLKIVIIENVWRIIDEINNDTFNKESLIDIKSKLDKIKDYANQAFAKLSSSKMHGGARSFIKDEWFM